MPFKILKAIFAINGNGDLRITGISERGCPVEIHITKDNPLNFFEVNNTFMLFRTVSKKTTYCIYFNSVDVSRPGCPSRLLQWSGYDKKAPTGMMYFISDLLSEVLYYHYKLRYFDSNAKLEVEYLKERYKECSKYISQLDFEIIVSQLSHRINLEKGVDEEGIPLF